MGRALSESRGGVAGREGRKRRGTGAWGGRRGGQGCQGLGVEDKLPGGRPVRKGLGRELWGWEGSSGDRPLPAEDQGQGGRVGGAWGLGAMGTGAWVGHRELEDMTVVL